MGQEPELPVDGARSPRRVPRIIVVSVVVALAVAVTALLIVGLRARGVSTAIDDAIAVGKPKVAPPFSLPLLVNAGTLARSDGSILSLSDLEGRPVVLNFWASWCIPCRAEAPRLEAAWRRHRRSGLVVLGLNVQDLSRSALRFVRGYDQTYPTVRDSSDRTKDAYGLTGIPETFFIDRRGIVRVHWIGEISERQLERGIFLLDKADSGGTR